MQCNSVKVNSIHFKVSQEFGSLVSVFPQFINKKLAVAILPSMAVYPQRLFIRELFVIGQS